MMSICVALLNFSYEDGKGIHVTKVHVCFMSVVDMKELHTSQSVRIPKGGKLVAFNTV